MPKLTNMKLDRSARQKESYPSSIATDGPIYPYGLRVRLDDEELTALDISKLPRVGSTMTLIARVDVSSVSSNESADGGKHRSVELQITDLCLEDEDEAASAAKALYTT